MVHALTDFLRTSTVILGLALMLVCSFVFFRFGDGLLGTNFETLSEALTVQTDPSLADDVYPCQSLNGEGSDDNISVLALRLLGMSLLWRLFRFRHAPSKGEAALFFVLSSPAFVFHFGLATCAQAMLTLLYSWNLALVGCIIGWCAAAVGYLWAKQRP